MSQLLNVQPPPALMSPARGTHSRPSGSSSALPLTCRPSVAALDGGCVYRSHVSNRSKMCHTLKNGPVAAAAAAAVISLAI
eukprot:CAMPEP_0171926872 /NCGR_PEP_ID=MMETSP0993-20121228/25267_1 /TAXON_ID=483369 /ORGANISM="non described non described, Strain CCMP2098" /LENGTH=80 /DNA_ID=CAMNT_0012565783 /DNA_START=125 /DNA_END=367 /DNA_ORIENTATION=-